MTNTTLLKAIMILHNDSTSSFAKHIGINRQNASKKINGKSDFKQSEIVKITNLYNLTDSEIRNIFLS